MITKTVIDALPYGKQGREHLIPAGTPVEFLDFSRVTHPITHQGPLGWVGVRLPSGETVELAADRVSSGGWDRDDTEESLSALAELTNVCYDTLAKAARENRILARKSGGVWLSTVHAVEYAIDVDADGYARAAAWLAAARIDPEHFRTLAQTRAQQRRLWDRLGVAQGQLMLGDVQALNELLQWVRAGDASQRLVASRALFKWLRPLLAVAGRWPADSTVREGEAWPAEFVSEIERRCAELDLQAIADDTRRHAARTDSVRRSANRLARARDGLAGVLFAR